MLRKGGWLIFLCINCSFVFSQITASFTPSKLAGCPPLVVTFTDNSVSTPSPSSWTWTVNGTLFSNLKNPSNTFFAPGDYWIKLTVSNGVSVDTFSRNIHVYKPPVAAFKASDTVGCLPLTVHFSDSTKIGEAFLVNWAWDFVTPPSSGLQNPNKTYTTAGHYTVSLVVSDANGCSANLTKTNYINVGSTPPVVGFNFTPTGGCSTPLNVNFTNTTTGGSNPTYNWSFGDGNLSNAQNPSNNYLTGGTFPITLTAINDNGCSASSSQSISIQSVVANFTADRDTICAFSSVNFTNTSLPAGNSWLWNFGDGLTSIDQNPTHQYTAPGPYTVSLTTTNGLCSDQITKTFLIQVLASPSVSFAANDSISCGVPFLVNFTSHVVGSVNNYAWTFGDGNLSSLPNPPNTYTSVNNFSVSLTVSNSTGCSTTVSKPNYIQISPPTAGFTADRDSGCLPATINFTNTSNPNTGLIYEWAKNGIVFSSLQNPVLTITAEGSYNISLKITTPDGCTDSVNKIVRFGKKSKPDFVADHFSGCLSDIFIFTNLSQDTTSQTAYFWDFGDGNDVVKNPQHVFIDTGCHTIKLRITNVGCSSDTSKTKYICSDTTKAKFVYSYNCNNELLINFFDTFYQVNHWQWNFGDNSLPVFSKNPVHLFPALGTYKVTVKVWNTISGCVDSFSQQIKLGLPKAVFTADTTFGCAPFSVKFTSDSSKIASSFYWDFGDNSFATTANPTKIYNVPGHYNVKLVINKSLGCPDSVVRNQYIFVKGAVTGFTADTFVGCAPLTVHFKDTSKAANTLITGYHWNFGDGDTSNQKNPVHTFTTSQYFNVTLIVFDTAGCSVPVIKPNYISTVRPVAKFKADTLRCIGEQCNFNFLGSGATTYLWDFGDNTTSPQTNPTHFYQNYGYYTVKLTVKNAVGCDSTLILQNYIHVDSPHVNFTVAGTFSPCPPLAAIFANTSVRKDMKFTWIFGDGKADSSILSKDTVVHVYFHPGLYSVTLIGVTQYGCTDTLFIQNLIDVRGPRLIDSAITPKSGCEPLVVHVSGTIIGANVVQFFPGDGVLNDSVNFNYTYYHSGDFEVKYVLTDTNGCTVPYVLDTIHVLYTSIPNLFTDTSVCDQNHVQFNIPPADHILWSPNSGLSCDSCPNPYTSAHPTFIGSDTITYIVTTRNDNGCTASDTAKINVDPLPDLNPGDTFTLCRNQTFQLNAGKVYNAAWTPKTQLSDSSAISPIFTATNSQSIVVSSHNHLNCVVSKTVNIGIIDKVKINSFLDTTVCEGFPVRLYTEVVQASASGIHYQWTPLLYIQSDTLFDVIATPKTTTTYQVIATSSTCEPDTATRTITINPSPNVTAGDNQITTPASPIRLWAKSTIDSVSFEWKPQTSDDIECIYCDATNFRPKTTQFIIVEVTANTGCKSTDTVYIKVVECGPAYIYVPNTFTPNGDGLNDVLYAHSLILSKLEFFRVFDRWGEIIFETKDLEKGWDGKYGSLEAQSGVYAFSLEGICKNGDHVFKSGNVMLVK